MVLISYALGARLPEELLHNVLVRLDDREYLDERPPKRGLASCSLVCRHWARIIRPMLFEHLTLSSAEDVSQLFAFLNARDFLDCPLRGCVEEVDLVEDRTPTSTPWGHHFFLMWCRQALPGWVTWAITGAPIDDQVQPPQKLSLLPSALLPRALPTSTVYLARVVLSGLQVLSIRSLVNLTKSLQIGWLKLDDITFTEEIPSPRHIPRTHSSLRNGQNDHYLLIQNCIRRSSSLPFWVNLSNALFASQRCPPLDDDSEQLVARYFHLFASLHQCEDNISRLRAIYVHCGNGIYDYEYFLHKFGTEDEFAYVYVSKRTGNNARQYIDEVKFRCPNVGDIDMPSLLEQLEAGLIDVNDPDAPELCIECENVETGRALIHGILEGRVSAQLRTRPRQVIVDIARPRRSLTIEDILSAPTCISQNDGTISLTAAQRTQWVLRKDVFERRKYLSKLVRAARAARVLAAAGSGAVPCAVNDAEDGMGEQIQQITEDQDEWGGEDVSSGDPC